MTQLKIGILGGGNVSKARAEKIGRFVDCRITAVCSDVQEVASEMASQYGAQPFTDWQRFLKEADMDAVVISTPNFLHFQMALEAVRQKKHTAVEYPMTLTLEDYDTLAAEAQKNGVILHHGLNCQLEGYYLTVKNLLPRIGKLLCTKTRWFGGKTVWYENDEKRGSMWVAFHIHFIDHFRGMFGEPEWIEAVDQSVAEEHIPLGTMFIGYKDKFTAYMEFGHGFDPAPPWSWTILGTKGYIEFDGVQVRLITRDGEQHVEMIESNKFEIDSRNFVDRILKGAQPFRSLEDARRSIQLSIIAEKAAQQGVRIEL